MNILTRTFLCLIFLVYGLNTVAQDDIDKLLQEYKSATLDQKLELFYVFKTEINADTLLYYVKDIQYYGLEENRDDALAFANLGMAYILQSKNIYKAADEKLNKSLDYFQKIGNDSLISSAYIAMGNSAFHQGNLSKAELLYHKSLKYAKSKDGGNKKSEMSCLYNIAKIYIKQEKNKEALQIIKDYIEFLKKGNSANLKNLANAYGALGQIHLNQEDYEQAIQDFNNSMEYGLIVGNMSTVSNSYTNLGIVEFYSDNIERSEQYFRLALAYRLKGGKEFYIAEGYYNLGDFYSGIDKNDSAIVNYKKSAEVAKLDNNLKTQVDALSQLSTVYNYLDEKDRENKVLKEIIALQDKINEEQNEDILNALGLSYDQSIKEFKNVSKIREGKLRSQVGKFESIFNNWLVITLIGVIALILLFLYIRKRNKTVKKAS